jgi:hypothetical protein
MKRRIVVLLAEAILIISLISCNVIATSTSNEKDSGIEHPESVTIDSPEVPPEDILQQVRYFAGGGGGTDECTSLCFKPESRRIVIRDFPPNQSLRILVYKPVGQGSTGYYLGVGKFVTEWYVEVDENGRLDLPVRGDSAVLYDYIVLDAERGETLRLIGNNYTSATIPNGGFSEGDIILSKSGDERLNIRKEPNYSGKVIDQVTDGSEMLITGHSRIVKGERWWPVKTEHGMDGWVTELWIKPVR